MSLRILLVHERFAPDYGGGGEYVVLQTAKQLQERGHRVRVICSGDPAQDRFEGIALKRLPISRYRFNLAWREVAAEAREVDLIHGFSNHAARPAALAGQRLGKPVVLGVLALFGPVWREMRGPVVGRLFEQFERMMLRLPVQRRIFLSPDSAAQAQRMGLARPSDCVIPPGISLEDYRADAAKDGVLFSGKLDVRKGTPMLLQLARELPEIPFQALVWGEDFEAFARAAPPNLQVRRFVDRRQLADALAAARIFLFPSKAETFGLVVAEAMASGCAVVGSAPLAFEGARIDPHDFAGSKAALLSLWSDPARCADCGARNARAAQSYGWPRHMAQLELVYQQLLEQV